jgi:hypothetical protein
MQDGRYKLCIGTFGAITFDCELGDSEQQRLHVSSSVGSATKLRCYSVAGEASYVSGKFFVQSDNVQ